MLSPTSLAFWKWQMWVISVNVCDGWVLTGDDLTNHSLSVFVCLQKVIFPNQDDVLISFLPLAHMFERLIEVGPAWEMCFLSRFITLIIQSSRPLRETHTDLCSPLSSAVSDYSLAVCQPRALTRAQNHTYAHTSVHFLFPRHLIASAWYDPLIWIS